MKKLLFILSLVVFLSSCEDETVLPIADACTEFCGTYYHVKSVEYPSPTRVDTNVFIYDTCQSKSEFLSDGSISYETCEGDVGTIDNAYEILSDSIQFYGEIMSYRWSGDTLILYDHEEYEDFFYFKIN